MVRIARMFPYRRLKVWERAQALAVAVLRDRTLDAEAPTRILAVQLRRAALSIPVNIAEGAGSDTHALFARYLGIARASASEVECLLLAGRDAALLPAVRAELLLREVDEIQRMLTTLRARVRSESKQSRNP